MNKNKSPGTQQKKLSPKYYSNKTKEQGNKKPTKNINNRSLNQSNYSDDSRKLCSTNHHRHS